MKQALILIDEINRKKVALTKAKSQYIRNDYSKSIRSDIEELKEYCSYKGLDFSDLRARIK